MGSGEQCRSTVERHTECQGSVRKYESVRISLDTVSSWHGSGRYCWNADSQWHVRKSLESHSAASVTAVSVKPSSAGSAGPGVLAETSQPVLKVNSAPYQARAHETSRRLPRDVDSEPQVQGNARASHCDKVPVFRNVNETEATMPAGIGLQQSRREGLSAQGGEGSQSVAMPSDGTTMRSPTRRPIHVPVGCLKLIRFGWRLHSTRTTTRPAHPSPTPPTTPDLVAKPGLIQVLLSLPPKPTRTGPKSQLECPGHGVVHLVRHVPEPSSPSVSRTPTST